MEDEDANTSNAGLSKLLDDSDERPRSAVNSVVLDYYKKFGRKRDLEQYFSLTTAQSDIRDPRSLFWRRMKEQSDTSDSGEKKSESSNEICRISIKCSIPERSETEKRESPSNNESESPPIITDVLPVHSPSGDDSIDDNHSQKSADATLDTSINKPLSPTSSITSQRKLEWDSLADVGYGNESDKKTSASSLSTLEREVLAQKQQYTLDYKQSSDIGLPTAHSTPAESNDNPKGKKGLGKKTISISRKDVDCVQVNLPNNMGNVQPINVNLTKQFSVNLQKDGGMTIDNVRKDISISPEKNADTEINTGVKFDKEIQTSLLRSKEKDKSSIDCSEKASTSTQKIPLLISLNTLRRKQRRKKVRKSRTKLKSKKKLVRRKEVITDKDKSGEQVSEAESFEYMPGHMYNQNQLRKQNPNRSNNNNTNVGNKSSLESSAVHTTDSSKESKYSFGKDLDKTLNVLKSTLKEKYDSKLKKRLVTDIIQRLIRSNYGEGETTPEFLSVLSLISKKTPTTSTSEADNVEGKVAHSKPKKSILRSSKFDPRNLASTSQSAPNLPSVAESDKPVTSYLSKMVSSNTTETDMSNNSAKEESSSDTVGVKTSQELYEKYINALKKEEAYKQHLRDKELFLKQKLFRSVPVRHVPGQLDLSKNNNLKDLIKDLTRNNYDDGSGDASILEGGSSNIDIVRQQVLRKPRSHSVFTLSSGNSDMQQQTCGARNRLLKNKLNSPRAGPSTGDRNLNDFCNRPAVTDSSVQVNIKDNPPKLTEEAKYVCVCSATCHHEAFKCPVLKSCVNQPVCGMHCARSLKEDSHTECCSNHRKKEKNIIECTRCLQTKLSVHPKISDPSESDLNIIDSAECVKLINELYKTVSKTSSECRCSNEKYDCNSYTCKSSKDNIRRNDRDQQDNLIEDVNQIAPLTGQGPLQENLIRSCQQTIKNHPQSINDNIVIPIHGTNMMLKLSIDGKTLTVPKERMPNAISDNVKTIDKEVITDEINTTSKGMSIFDECSKSTQAESSNIGKIPTGSSKPEIKSKQDILPQELDIGRNIKKEVELQRKNNYGFVSDSLLTQPAGRSTYPKKVQINENKPLFRTNTDTGNLGARSSIQTKAIYTIDKEPHSYFRVESNQDLGCQKKSEPMADGRTQAQSAKGTPSDHSISGSSKSSTEERFHSFNTSKNKYSGEWQKIKDQKSYDTDEGKPKDLILEVIKDITKRYSKRDTDKRTKKKCFKEIITALSYLLDTDDSGDGDQEFSQSSKGVQCQKEQSPRSVSSNTERSKAIGKSCSATDSAENLPQKSNTYERSARTVSSNPGCRQNRRFSEASGVAKVDNSSSNAVPPLKLTCDMGCGCDGTTECNDCMCVGPSKKTDSGRSGNKSPRSGNNANRRFSEASGDAKVDNSSSKAIPPLKQTCDMGCGCDGTTECNDCMGSSKKTDLGRTGNKSPKAGNNANRRCSEASRVAKVDNSSTKAVPPLKLTCDMGCGCDGTTECNDCMGLSKKTDSGRSGNKSPRAGNNALKIGASEQKKACELTGFEPGNRSQVAYRLEKGGLTYKSEKNKTCGNNISTTAKHGYNPPNKIRTVDTGCGPDSSLERKDCIDSDSSKYDSRISKESATSKKQKSNPPKCNSPKKTKTCDVACGCDSSSECKNYEEPHSPSFKKRPCKEREPKQEVRCGSPKESCKSDSSCGDSVERHCPRFTNKECKNRWKHDRCTSPKKTETCDRGCGCDDSSQCSECVEPRSPKNVKRGRQSVKPNKQDRCSSPRKIKTCDKSCGRDDSPDRNECVDSYSSNYESGKCGKESIRPKKQDRCASPRKTHDKRTTLYECGENTKQQSRCNSPKRIRTTCDKSCGCDGTSECKECSHKSNRCDKEVRNKRQDAKKFVNKCVQSTVKRVRSLYSHHCDESSDIPVSTDPPCCSTDSPTSKLVHKIKKECEKYQKRCKSCRKCEASSTTAVSCDCRRAEKHCRHHRCRCHRKSAEKKKKCVAYNLIVQTSDSLVSEEAVFDRCRPLQNVIVKVPKYKPNVPFKEVCTKIEQKMPFCDTRFEPKGRSQSWPNECGLSSTDDVKMANACSVRDYLEKNRPDFVDRCETRQNCIRMTSESRAKERSELREQLVGLESLPTLTNEELIYLAKQLGRRRHRPSQQKIISEREMKQHSEKIYKSLPEVVQKKEDAKKENIKKTNLLMANIFKKNLQKKALHGDVNISNYSQVVRI